MMAFQGYYLALRDQQKFDIASIVNKQMIFINPDSWCSLHKGLVDCSHLAFHIHQINLEFIFLDAKHESLIEAIDAGDRILLNFSRKKLGIDRNVLNPFHHLSTLFAIRQNLCGIKVKCDVGLNRYNSNLKFKMMDTPFVEKAIPMVSVDENTGKYVVTPAAINFLKAINGPIAVVSVAGLYRTGKSYLLNLVLLNRSNGFGVGPTVNPCTKGLWCWGTPIKGTTQEGQAVNIIVIDTEGIGALDEDQTHDTKIFTLAILASSCFIYNSVGSIDETAIQNLSLVVNLTKHIQLKAASPDEEGEDPDEIASYFPTFYWVVRDFSLQLQDPEGNSISSKEYLERALAPQNGFSDDVEEKNRIRRLLSAFFKDRDCFTMIRPLVDETKLQNLDKMDYDQLRPEFVQQAMSFRKKIISGVKSKTLQNQKLNGTLYCSMITSYVKAINEGAVPNIENAWSYMCEQQCNRAFEECFEIYGNAIQDGLRDLPRSEDDFLFHTSEAEQKALEAYRSKALGDHAPNGLKQLKKRIRTHIAELREDNIKESSKQLRDYIVKNASLITKKLNSQQYSSYAEYEKEIVALGEKFNKEGPKLHNHRFTYMEAIRKLSAQGAEFLFKNFTKSQQKTMEMFKEKEKQMVQNMNSLKEEYERLRKNYNQTVTDADHKLVELNNREETLKRQLQITMHLKEEEDRKRERDFESKSSDFKAKHKSLQEKYNELLNRFEEDARNNQMDQKKWEKEKAVLEQKVSLNQTLIDELKSKEKSLDANLNMSKANMSKEVRDISLRFEKEREELKSELNIKTEKLNEISEELTSVKEQLTELNEKSQKKENKLKQDYNGIKKQMERLKQNLQNQRKQMREEWNRSEQKLINEKQSIQEQLRQQERISRQREQYLQKQIQQSQIQCSTIEQQFVYAKSQNNSLKSKVSQMKESYQLALSNYEATLKESNEETFTQRMLEINKQHKAEMQKLNQNHEIQMERQSNKHSNLLKAFDQLQKSYNTLSVEKMQKQGETKSVIQELKKKITDTVSQKMNYETYHNRNMQEANIKHERQMQELKNQFQEFKQKARIEYEHIVDETNTKLGQLGNQYSANCETLQKNIASEKQRAAKEQQRRIEQLQSKYEEERDRIIEEYEDILANYVNECQQYKKTVSDLQHINEMQAKEIAKLEQINKELKQFIDKKTIEFNDKETKMISEFKEEKSKLESKLETQIIIINEKEKENVTLRHENSQIVSGIEKKEAIIRQMDMEMKEYESKYTQQRERIASNFKQKEKEFNEKISNASQENALIKQQIDYETKKSKDLQEKFKELSTNTESKFNEMKASKEEEIKILIIKYNTEKAALQAKCSQLKKSEKEMEASLKKECNQLRTDNALFYEKLSNTEIRLRESETIRNQEIGSLRQELSRVKESANTKEKELTEMLKSTKAKLQAISNEKMSLNMILQKERVLNQKSIEMLEKTKQQAKKEFQDRLNALQAQLTNQRNIRFNDKSSLDSNYRSMITSMENEYKQKNQNLIDTLNRVRNDYENLKFNSEKEIKSLVYNYEQDKNQRMIDFGNLERRFNELSEKQRISTTELAKILKERDGRVDEILKKEAAEKDSLKRKQMELEARLKETQNINMNNNLLIQRERSKWAMEKSDLSEKQRELIENVKFYKQKAEKNKAEVDKFKNQRKGAKTIMHSQFSVIKPSLNEVKIEKTIMVEDNNKENSSMQ